MTSSPARSTTPPGRRPGDLLGRLHAAGARHGASGRAGELAAATRKGTGKGTARAATWRPGTWRRGRGVGRRAGGVRGAAGPGGGGRPVHDLPAAVIHLDPVMPTSRHPHRRADPGRLDRRRAGAAGEGRPWSVLLQSVAVGPAGVDPGAVDPVVRAYRGARRARAREAGPPGAALRLRGLWLACWMYALAVSSGRVTGHEWWWPDGEGARRWRGRAGRLRGRAAPGACSGASGRRPGKVR